MKLYMKYKNVAVLLLGGHAPGFAPISSMWARLAWHRRPPTLTGNGWHMPGQRHRGGATPRWVPNAYSSYLQARRGFYRRQRPQQRFRRLWGRRVPVGASAELCERSRAICYSSVTATTTTSSRIPSEKTRGRGLHAPAARSDLRAASWIPRDGLWLVEVHSLQIGY